MRHERHFHPARNPPYTGAGCPMTDPRTAHTREVALAAAHALALEQGPDAVTHSAVARRSGLSRSTLYRHWRTVESLLEEVNGDARSLVGDAGVRDDLIVALEALRDNLEAERTLVATPDERAALDAVLGRLRDRTTVDDPRDLRRLLRRGVARGELKSSLDEERALEALAEALVLQVVVRGDKDPTPFFARVVDDFLAARRPAPGTSQATAAPDPDAVAHLPARHRAVKVLRRSGPVSRAGLARHLGISRSSMSPVVAELLRDDVIVEMPKEPSEPALAERTPRVGRPGTLLALNPRAGAAVGVDFGHRHVCVVLCDLAHRVLAERRRALPLGYEPNAGIARAADLITDALTEAGVDRERVIGVGMGLPGPIDARTGVASESSIALAWVGVPAAERLSARVGLPVMLDNDANLGALAELVWGAGRGERHVLYVKVGTGIGAGVVSDGRLLRGAAGVAGELGHVTVDPNGPMCRCGNRGCLETLVGTDSLLATLAPNHPDGLTIERVVQLAVDDDRGVRRALADAGAVLGIALANAVNLLNPAAVIIGGEVSGAGEALIQPIRTGIERSAIRLAAAGLRVVAGELGARAEALGAVALVLHESDRYVSVPSR
jgi:predicted NBD/HSP70 family sugar kinase/transposase-like protein